MDKNPYTERDYFERRYKNFNLDKFRKAVYVRHKYKCAACNELLDDSEAVELHHIIPRYKGGKYTLDNIVPLHKTCHGSVTYARKE
jgi:5-methylcytosine-specific restriction endonuclease McrA